MMVLQSKGFTWPPGPGPGRGCCSSCRSSASSSPPAAVAAAELLLLLLRLPDKNQKSKIKNQKSKI